MAKKYHKIPEHNSLPQQFGQTKWFLPPISWLPDIVYKLSSKSNISHLFRASFFQGEETKIGVSLIQIHSNFCKECSSKNVFQSLLVENPSAVVEVVVALRVQLKNHESGSSLFASSVVPKL